MTSNIQTATPIPSQPLLHYFGFHIALMERGYDGEPSTFEEGIGNHYESIQNFENLEQVERFVRSHYKEQANRNSLRLSKINWNLITLFKKSFFAFGFFKELKTSIEQLKKVNEKYVQLLADPLGHTIIKKLDEHIIVPKYLIGEQDCYYYPSLKNNILVLRKLKCIRRTIQKISFLTPYTHSFSYDFKDVNDEKFDLHYSFLSLFRFDEEKWGYKLGEDLLFLSEEAAKNHIAAFYKEHLTAVV